MAVAHENIIDAEPLCLVAKLLPLALEDVALPLVVLDPLVELIERVDGACFERLESGKSLKLVVDLPAFDPGWFDADGDLEHAGAGGDHFGLGLPRHRLLRQARAA